MDGGWAHLWIPLTICLQSSLCYALFSPISPSHPSYFGKPHNVMILLKGRQRNMAKIQSYSVYLLQHNSAHSRSSGHIVGKEWKPRLSTPFHQLTSQNLLIHLAIRSSSVMELRSKYGSAIMIMHRSSTLCPPK